MGRFNTEDIVKNMVGLTFNKVEQDGDDLVFIGDRKFRFYHEQDCCETFQLVEMEGDLSYLEGSPLVLAEEISSEETPELKEKAGCLDYSYTWTFYKFATAKGYVTVRWVGDSNGYYSEEVDVVEVTPFR